MTASQVSFGPVDAPRLYQGRVIGLAGDRLRARVSAAPRAPLTLDVTLRLAGTRVTGRLRVSTAGATQP